MTQRIDELTAPPVIGQFYLVPTVEGVWYGRRGVWPVIGPKHNDAQCLDFDAQHFHIDGRFIAGNDDDWPLWRRVFGGPMSVTDQVNVGGLPAPIWRRRKCQRLVNPKLNALQKLAAGYDKWRCHFDQWEGRQARHDGRGWVCPHRSVPLADHPAVDGIITCPLHLLRIDAGTGRVLPQEVAE